MAICENGSAKPAVGVAKKDLSRKNIFSGMPLARNAPKNGETKRKWSCLQKWNEFLPFSFELMDFISGTAALHKSTYF